jgi:hypothetical protein
MTKTLKSGTKLEMTMGSFEESHRLMKAVAKELEGIPLDSPLKILSSVTLRALSSEAIEAALWPCMNRCLYNDRHINKELFQDEKIREDFVEVAKEVLDYNLAPFLKNLSSLLSDIKTQATFGQRQ